MAVGTSGDISLTSNWRGERGRERGDEQSKQIAVVYVVLAVVIMEAIRGKQENSNIYHCHDGFFFYRNKTVNGIEYYRCTHWRQGCPVRGNLKSNGTFCTTLLHNHPADSSRADVLAERSTLMNEARRLDVATVRDIFQHQR